MRVTGNEGHARHDDDGPIVDGVASTEKIVPGVLASETCGWFFQRLSFGRQDR